ncbi:hypothetical protein M9H77_01989 [Catharanthus roseus]|uniref:Uncharacterized protein n=1 Tax=Catharanthus roseus TaxID=4058 RepID=A0ACC0C7C2_CATRO|nr:hypothetical protein M9H77_01989 [Catharanthus roseus]
MSRHAISAASWGRILISIIHFPLKSLTLLPTLNIPSKVLTQDRMKIRLTWLPIPETRIGDLIMYIPSRRLENTFVAIRNEAYVAIFDNVVSQLSKTLSMANFRAYHAQTASSPFDWSTSSSLTLVYNIDGSSETICVTAMNRLCPEEEVHETMKTLKMYRLVTEMGQTLNQEGEARAMSLIHLEVTGKVASNPN